MTRMLIALLICFFSFSQAQTYVELILDASGSMWNKLEDDRYRIVAAKDVLTQFIGGLPDTDLNVGLRIYGSQMPALEEGSCDDTELFVPMSGIDKAALSQTVQNADALGATPIAKSLLAAADDFPADAERRVLVLVTDGEESCGGNLEAVADELANRGFEIDIRIIGFDLDDAAIESFEGIGTFENAENAEQLAQALETAVEDVVAEAPVIADDCETLASLSVAAEVEASYSFSVGFEGPEGRISLHPLGGDKFSALESAHSGNSNPASLLAPSEAGSYELRYIASAGNCVIATTPLTVIPIQASLSAPEQIEAGFEFPIEFSGPEGIIAIFTSEMDNSQHNDLSNYFTKWTQPATLTAPTDAGSYEIRYLDTNRGTVTTIGIEVLASAASLNAAEQVEAGFEFPVEFTGPEGIIAIYTEAMENGEYTDFSYHFTKWTKPSTLTAPTEAGTYEIRYIDTSQGTLTTVALEVLATTASLSVPEQVEAGFEFTFEFLGPEGIVALYKSESENRDYNDISYYFTKWNKDPSSLVAPTEAGFYEVRYIDENQGTLASQTIEVLASTATLIAPTQVEAGYPIVFEFTGPEGIVAIYKTESENRDYNDISYYFTKWNKDPSSVFAPTEAGTYELRYIDDSQGTLASSLVEVLASTASINAPTEITPATEFSLDTSGPEGIVAIFELSSPNGDYNKLSYFFTKWGKSRSLLTSPETAGTYEIRYLDDHKGSLVSQVLTVK